MGNLDHACRHHKPGVGDFLKWAIRQLQLRNQMCEGCRHFRSGAHNPPVCDHCRGSEWAPADD